MIASFQFMVVSLAAYTSTLPQTAPADLAVLMFAGTVLVLGS